MPSLNTENKPTWLLSVLDPFYDDIGFGLFDLGMGFPELGAVSLEELANYVHPISEKPLI